MKNIFRYLFVLCFFCNQTLSAMESYSPSKDSSEDVDSEWSMKFFETELIPPSYTYLILTNIKTDRSFEKRATYTFFNPGSNELYPSITIGIKCNDKCPLIITAKMVSQLHHKNPESVVIPNKRNSFKLLCNNIHNILHSIRYRTTQKYQSHAWVNDPVYTQKALACAQKQYAQIISKKPMLFAYITRDIDDNIKSRLEDESFPKTPDEDSKLESPELTPESTEKTPLHKSSCDEHLHKEYRARTVSPAPLAPGPDDWRYFFPAEEE